jgi:hypothetical protein
MPLTLSPLAENTMCQMLPVLLDSDGGQGLLEFFTRSGTLLATLKFSRPAAHEPEGGSISFAPIESGVAVASGQAVRAAAKTSDGTLVFEADVGTMDSSAVIKLSETNIVAGSPIRIRSFVLSTS